MLGHDWQPLQPVDVTRDGQTISVRFHVPNPPLAWDEAFGAPHQFVHAAWKNGRGFEVEDSQGEVTITEAVIDGDTIRIGIDRLPDTTSAPLVVRYATTQDATQLAGRPRQRPLRPAPRFGSAGRRRRGRVRLHRDDRFDGRHAGDRGRLHDANRARHGRRRRRRRGPGPEHDGASRSTRATHRSRTRGRARPARRDCAFDRTSGTMRSPSS